MKFVAICMLILVVLLFFNPVCGGDSPCSEKYFSDEGGYPYMNGNFPSSDGFRCCNKK